MVKVELDSVNAEQIRRRLVACLKKGGVAMAPTDTIYGLFCRADKTSIVSKVFAIKRRDHNKPLLVLVSSLTMAKKYCQINLKQQAALKLIWSKSRPTTVLLRHRQYLPSNLTAGSINLAVRLPKSIFLRKMIRAVGVPLVSTSANISGEDVLDAEKAINVFKKEPRPDMIVAGDLKKGRASQLISLDEHGQIKIIRKNIGISIVVM